MKYTKHILPGSSVYIQSLGKRIHGPDELPSIARLCHAVAGFAADFSLNNIENILFN